MGNSYRQQVAMPYHWLFYFAVIALSVGLMTTSHYLYALVPPLAILSVLLLGSYLPVGYYLIVFLFPFRTITGIFEIEHVATISVQKILGLVILLAILLLFLFKKRVAPQVQSSLWGWLIFFGLVSFVSAAMSSFRLEALSGLRALFNPYVLFLMTLVFVSEKGFRKTLPLVVVVSVLVNSVLSVLGYFVQMPAFLGGNEEVYQRWQGAAGDPNVFSAMIIFSLPLVAHRFFTARNAGGRVVYLVVFLVSVAAILLTLSRGGIIVFAFTLALLAVKYAGKLKPRYLGFVSLLAALATVAVLAVVPSAFYERMSRITETRPKVADSVGQRLSYLIVGWDVFKKNPVFGTGPGTFQDVYAQSAYAREYMKEYDDERRELAAGEDLKLRRAAHNTYMEVLVGTGLPGFLCFVGIILVGFRNFRRAKAAFLERGDPDMASLTGSYAVALASLTVYFLFLSTFYHHYFWISLAVSQVALRLSREQVSEQGREAASPAR